MQFVKWGKNRKNRLCIHWTLVLLYLDYFRDELHTFYGYMNDSEWYIVIEHQEDVAVENQEHHRCWRTFFSLICHGLNGLRWEESTSKQQKRTPMENQGLEPNNRGAWFRWCAFFNWVIFGFHVDFQGWNVCFFDHLSCWFMVIQEEIHLEDQFFKDFVFTNALLNAEAQSRQASDAESWLSKVCHVHWNQTHKTIQCSHGRNIYASYTLGTPCVAAISSWPWFQAGLSWYFFMPGRLFTSIRVGHLFFSIGQWWSRDGKMSRHHGWDNLPCGGRDEPTWFWQHRSALEMFHGLFGEGFIKL